MVIKGDTRSLDNGSCYPTLNHTRLRHIEHVATRVSNGTFFLQALGLCVHRYESHWALKSISISYLWLFGALGLIIELFALLTCLVLLVVPKTKQ